MSVRPTPSFAARLASLNFCPGRKRSLTISDAMAFATPSSEASPWKSPPRPNWRASLAKRGGGGSPAVSLRPLFIGSPARLSTFRIVSAESSIPWRRRNSDLRRCTPRFSAFLSATISASSRANTFRLGEEAGLRLESLRPSTPASWYRRHHFLRVGRETLNCEQTNPAFPVAL